MADDTLRIVVLGYLVRGPIGGMAWGSQMHYLAGLRDLGHDVYLLEDSGDAPWACWDPELGMINSTPTYGLRFAADALASVRLGERWAYLDAPRRSWHGPLAGRVADVCASADLLIDIGGVNQARPWLMVIPRRILLDLDPVFTQVASLNRTARAVDADRYTAFFTFGQNFGQPDCTIPDDGIPWQPTRPPVHLASWPASRGSESGCYTTVMQWESYPAAAYGRAAFGLKAQSFGPYLELPGAVAANLELAVGGDHVPSRVLRRHGWRLRDPLEASRTPRAYQAYIRQSKAEFTVAKHGYAATRSGWFSERSASYLASGRPVITQDTGFSEWLEPGLGVLAFSCFEEAVAAIEEVDAHYSLHCAAAREIAEAHFDSRRVLGELLDRAHASAVSSSPSTAVPAAAV